MELTDKKITCADCGKEFTFTASEQKFFQEKGYQDPKRCPACRKARKQERSAGPHQMYEIICAKCGEKGQVPFKPRNPEGLLCEKCFQAQRKK